MTTTTIAFNCKQKLQKESRFFVVFKKKEITFFLIIFSWFNQKIVL